MFFIIDGDKPIYQLYAQGSSQNELKVLLDVHANLDYIDSLQLQKKDCFLGFIKFEEPTIVCQSTPTNLRMILVLHLSKKECTKQTEERIRGFFERVSQFLGIAIMNPLYKIHSEITSQIFDAKVREQMTKRLGVFIQRR